MPKSHVLIADASPTFRAVLRSEFDPKRFELTEVGTGPEAIRQATRIKPTLATISMVLPGRDGIDVCAVLTADKTLAHTTIVMITSSDSQGARGKAFDAGAVRFIQKGFPKGELAAYADKIIESRALLSGTKILIVDDHPLTRTTLSRLLDAEGAEVRSAGDGHQGLAVLNQHDIDIIFTDYHMPNMDGITFVEAVRGMREHTNTPILFVSATREHQVAVRALDAGASDFIVKPFEATELLARLRSFARLAMVTKKLEESATTDELTGVANRRAGLEKMRELFDSAKRYGHDFSCVMIDIDRFKNLNDTHGHAAGDVALRETAHLLRDNIRTSDAVCRVGGEEFLVLCPHANRTNTARCAEKLRSAVEQHDFRYDGTKLTVTISLGVATFSTECADADAMLREADVALYDAKDSGRNKVVYRRAPDTSETRTLQPTAPG